MEIERHGARDLATAVSIAESLIELQRRERNSSPRKERNEGSSSHGKDGSYKPYKPKEGHNKVEGQKTVEARKGLPFVQMKLGGQEVLALMDTGPSNNFLKEEEAKRLGIPYEREEGWLKAVNSTPNLRMLGVEFMDRVKAILMLFANSMCITEGGGTYMVPLLRGKSSPSSTLATLNVEVQKSSSTATAVVHGKEQHGKGGRTPKSGPMECKEGNTPKLLKGHPPRRKVDCARGKSVAKSPRDVASPRQESRGKITHGGAEGGAKPRESWSTEPQGRGRH
ncbi:hypothetical protein GH714_009881 [Hevea brasiliensis]|uniref:Aspartic peptidase DDI1-type domain-containing protein n=1 Tax=Hevea brasiliensis TaxID=3981 RepID=A0A6A6NGB4_HEVBR|nr:hypothetical protein GH714_009881 [Hevea brasiliensis]